jgi:NAD(P)-dependent dehydrogenase (short-subunit alcohol dehydrogenase family)
MVSTAMTEQLRADPQLGVFADAYPSALGRPARPEEIASAIAFLLSEEAAVFVGATLFADGGTDAMMHR